MESKTILIFTGIGFELIALILAAVYVGEYLEERYSFGSWSVAGPVLVALCLWLVHLVALLMVLDKRSNNTERK